jgi:hypothetical protein
VAVLHIKLQKDANSLERRSVVVVACNGLFAMLGVAMAESRAQDLEIFNSRVKSLVTRLRSLLEVLC